MTLRQLTLTVSLLAASLMLASPAQAETWSCSYIDTVKREPKPFVFIRNGKNFDVQGSPLTLKVNSEDAKMILLMRIVYNGNRPSVQDDGFIPYIRPLASYTGALNKERKTFLIMYTTSDIEPAVKRTWVGNCAIH